MWLNVVSLENITSKPYINAVINIVIPPFLETLRQIIWINSRVKQDKAINPDKEIIDLSNGNNYENNNSNTSINNEMLCMLKGYAGAYIPVKNTVQY